jgi:hypothetical protein
VDDIIGVIVVEDGDGATTTGTGVGITAATTGGGGGRGGSASIFETYEKRCQESERIDPHPPVISLNDLPEPWSASNKT